MMTTWFHPTPATPAAVSASSTPAALSAVCRTAVVGRGWCSLWPAHSPTRPPTTRSLDADWLDGKRFLLFNLHGTPDSAHWYGQKDASYPADYPLFPVA